MQLNKLQSLSIRDSVEMSGLSLDIPSTKSNVLGFFTNERFDRLLMKEVQKIYNYKILLKFCDANIKLLF